MNLRAEHGRTKSISPLRGMWKKAGIRKFREIQSERKREPGRYMAYLPL